MNESPEENYLGDIISSKRNIRGNNQGKKVKGYSYITEIRASLSDMPFGNRRVEVGPILRDAKFVDKILCNSESWHNISEKNTEDLEVMDRMLMNIPRVLIQRRIMYIKFV